jgi:hypothetical protein
MTLLPRRRLLALIGGLAGSITGLAVGARPIDPVLLRAEALAQALRHRNSAAVVGHAYLAGAPEEADLAGLVRQIDPGPEVGDLRRAIAERVRADFVAGRMTRVEGWMLAETEARLAAVCALLDGPVVG